MNKKANKLKVFRLRPQKRSQERANALTHGIPALLSIAGLGPLIILAALSGNLRHTISFAIFGAALVFLFCASTIMHLDRSSGAVEPIYGFLDNVGINLVIAGTYTPLCLITLHGPLGWSLLGLVWSLAIAAIVLAFVYGERFMQYGNIVYLLMGWLMVIAIKPLAMGLGWGGMAFLIAGGASFTAGVVFLAIKPVFQYHAVFHLFVDLGVLLHLAMLVFYVLPDMH